MGRIKDLNLKPVAIRRELNGFQKRKRKAEIKQQEKQQAVIAAKFFKKVPNTGE